MHTDRAEQKKKEQEPSKEKKMVLNIKRLCIYSRVDDS